MEVREPRPNLSRRRRNVGVALIAFACIVVVVAVPTVTVLTRRTEERHHDGESTVQSGANKLTHQESLAVNRRSEEEVLLSDIQSSKPTTVLLSDLVEGNDASLMGASFSNVSRDSNWTSYYNNTSNSTLPATLVSTTAPPVATTSFQIFIPTPAPQIATTTASFQVLETIPHDTNAFTQGLTFDPANPDIVYESTGLRGQSDIRQVDIQTGQVLMLKPTPRQIFGEGLAYYTEAGAGRLIHITYTSRRGFIFDADTLETLQEFQFSTQRNEGWGITYNPNTDQFLVTDGSNYLHFWDRNLVELKRIPVFIQTSETALPERAFNLNEIEWDDETGTVLANVWKTDSIVRIDPDTGRVVTRYVLTQLYPNRLPGTDVFNGIAISPNKDLWVTGKWWPHMFRIALDV